MINGMKFSKSKCQILPHGAMSGTNQGEKCLESSPAQGVLGVLVHRRLNRSQQCVPWQPGGQTSSWSAPNTARVMFQRGDYPAVGLDCWHCWSQHCWSHLECCVQFWILPLKGDVKVLECVLPMAPKQGKGWQECPLSSG